jgi:hypothetical protein
MTSKFEPYGFSALCGLREVGGTQTLTMSDGVDADPLFLYGVSNAASDREYIEFAGDVLFEIASEGIYDERLGVYAAYYDDALNAIDGIRVPPRRANVKHVYHLYMVFAERRDALYQHCLDNGVEAKIHYPIPLYQQDGLKFLGYQPGAFPVTDRHAAEVISFPVDQHIDRGQQDIVIDTVRAFYENG